MESLPIEALDSTAAGDIFLGALAASIYKGENMKGENMLQALKFANAAAGSSVAVSGAQTSIPTLEKVLENMNRKW